VQLLTAAARVLLAQLQYPLRDVRRRLWLADVPGPAAAGLESSWSVLPVALNPAANGVGTAAKVAPRETRCSRVVRTSSPLTIGAWLLSSALPGAWPDAPLPAASPFGLSFERQRIVPSFVMLVSDMYLTLRTLLSQRDRRVEASARTARQGAPGHSGPYRSEGSPGDTRSGPRPLRTARTRRLLFLAR